MNATELLSRLMARGIRLRTAAGEIQVNRPGDILPGEREELRRLKPELLELIALRGREHEWPVGPVQGATQIDTTADDERFEERAAIRQSDGGLSREDAEILARHDLANELFPVGAA